MRKFVVAAMSGLFMAGVAFAQSAPAPDASPVDPQNVLTLDLSTGGRVRVLLRPDKAPYSVDRLKTLVRRHFYDGLIFHRVIEGFMAQGGDPQGTGEGGSDLPDLNAEFNDLPHVRGTMSLARAEGLNSANSQFFIMLQPNLNLDGNYTAIGRVISGMQYVDAIEKGEPPEKPSKVVRASIESDDLGQAPTAFVAPPPAAPAAAPVVNDKLSKKAKKRDDKRAKEQAKEESKAKTKKAKEDAKATKEAEEEAAKEQKRSARQAEKAAKDAPAPAAAVEAAPAPAVIDEQAEKARKQEEKLAKQQAEDEAKAAAKKAKEDAKAAKDAEEAAAKAQKAADKAAKDQAAQAEKDAKKAAKDAEKAAKAAEPAPAAEAPAPAPAAPETPPATDQAVQTISDQSSTDAAVQAVSADETVAQPQ